MNRLFVRIFLWFIVIQAVALTVFSVLLIALNEERNLLGSARGARLSVFLAQAAQASYEAQGAAGLQRFSALVARELQLQLELFSVNETAPLVELATGAAFTAQLNVPAFGQPPARWREGSASSILLRVAPAYAVKLTDPRPAFVPPFWRRVNLLRFFCAACAACLLCWFLARSLTRPLVELQQATQRLAAGEITQRVAVTRGDELGQLGHAFNTMAEKIAALLAERGELLRRVSHELRSPLARLTLTLELLRQEAARHDIATLRALTARCESEAQRLGALIGQLLQFSQVTQTSAPKATAEFDLEQLVLDVAADGNYEAELQGRAVEVIASLPCTVRGDRELLRSALENVLRNALRFTPTETTVTVQLQVTDHAHARVTITDGGPGVPPEALTRIFEPFYRLESQAEEHPGGAGLGLAIARHAVTAHGGTLAAANGMPHGLIVTMELPLAEATTPQENRFYIS